MRGTFNHAFEGRIAYHHVGTYRYTVVFLPDHLVEALPLAQHPRLRICGSLGGAPFTGAWQPVRGRWYLMLSKRVLSRSGYTVGDMAMVRFAVEDQDAVSLPDLLREALDADAKAKEAWDGLTAGKRRGLAHCVASARAEETKLRRVVEVMAALHTDDPIRARSHRQPRPRR